MFSLDGEVAHEMEDDQPRKSHKDDEEQIGKYRELLQSIREKEKKQEEKDIGMEVKWVPGKPCYFRLLTRKICGIGLLLGREGKLLDLY